MNPITFARMAAASAALVLVLLVQACSPARTSIPGVDDRRYPYLEAIPPGTLADDVLHRVGEPSQRKVWHHHETWGYAIRCCDRSGWGVPAVHLELTFDESGLLRGWRYRHPFTGVELPIRESLAEARAVEKGLCNVPNATPLASFLRVGATTRAEAERALTVTPPANHVWDFGVMPQRRAVAGGEAWTYDADRPSPLFFRPFYYVIDFENGRVRHVFPAGYGGCK